MSSYKDVQLPMRTHGRVQTAPTEADHY